MAATNRILIDTNVLVYALDPADQLKQRLAIDLLDELSRHGRGVVSVQCLTEFFNAITRKIAQPIPVTHAADHVADVAATFGVLQLTSEIVLSACSTVGLAQVSLWDALIWSAARHNNVATILTEDMQHRSSIDGIQYLNPFNGDFDITLIAEWDPNG